MQPQVQPAPSAVVAIASVPGGEADRFLQLTADGLAWVPDREAATRFASARVADLVVGVLATSPRALRIPRWPETAAPTARATCSR